MVDVSRRTAFQTLGAGALAMAATDTASGQVAAPPAALPPAFAGTHQPKGSAYGCKRGAQLVADSGDELILQGLVS